MTGTPDRAAAADPLGASLSWALNRSLPGREERWLLRALLHRGPSAHEAWAAFTARVGVGNLLDLFRTDTGGRKRLGPLLLASIRENALPADPALLTILKTAYLREALRVEALRTIARQAFDALRDREVGFLVLRGVALSETVYPEPALRHSHDIDVLVRDADLERAETAVGRAGFRSRVTLSGRRGVMLSHTTDTPLLLLQRLYRHPFYRTDARAIRRRSREVRLDALGAVAMPSAADNLLHALGHASYSPGRSNLLWVADAWMILRQEDSLDWAGLLEAVRESRLEIPAFVLLRYLEREIGAPVPGDALAALAALAAHAGKLRRDVALYGARQYAARHRQLTALERPGWKQRLDLLRWQTFPSIEYVSWAYRDPPRILLPAIYLLRPVTYAATVARWRFIGLARSLAGRLPGHRAPGLQEPGD